MAYVLYISCGQGWARVFFKALKIMTDCALQKFIPWHFENFFYMRAAQHDCSLFLVTPDDTLLVAYRITRA
jgi:hypothetical protein